MSPNSKKVPESTFLHDFNSSIKSDEQPTKELIRQWLMDRQNHPRPLPTIEQVKSELGWHFSKSLTAHREGIEKMNCFHDKPTQADIAMTRLKETTKYGSSTEAQMD